MELDSALNQWLDSLPERCKNVDRLPFPNPDGIGPQFAGIRKNKTLRL